MSTVQAEIARLHARISNLASFKPGAFRDYHDRIGDYGEVIGDIERALVEHNKVHAVGLARNHPHFRNCNAVECGSFWDQIRQQLAMAELRWNALVPFLPVPSEPPHPLVTYRQLVVHVDAEHKPTAPKEAAQAAPC